MTSNSETDNLNKASNKTGQDQFRPTQLQGCEEELITIKRSLQDGLVGAVEEGSGGPESFEGDPAIFELGAAPLAVRSFYAPAGHVIYVSGGPSDRSVADKANDRAGGFLLSLSITQYQNYVPAGHVICGVTRRGGLSLRHRLDYKSHDEEIRPMSTSAMHRL